MPKPCLLSSPLPRALAQRRTPFILLLLLLAFIAITTTTLTAGTVSSLPVPTVAVTEGDSVSYGDGSLVYTCGKDSSDMETSDCYYVASAKCCEKKDCDRRAEFEASYRHYKEGKRVFVFACLSEFKCPEVL